MQDIVFKNDNQKIVNKLSKRSYKKNKSRNRIAIIAIILTTLMFTTLFVLTESLNKNMIEMTFRQSGYDGQASFKYGMTDEIFEKIASHPDVKEAGKSIVVGVAENPELTGKQVEIRYSDDVDATHSFSMPTVGNMPKNKDEIALSTITLDRLKKPHKLGEEINLKWRNDMNSDDITEKTFKLSGYWKGNENSYAEMAWLSEDFVLDTIGHIETNEEGQFSGMRTAQVILNSDKNIEKTMDKILSDLGLPDLDYGINIAYDEGLRATSIMESIPMYIGMLLVFLAGFLIIYNIFQISIISDIQFYGKLKTLGTTQRQIKKLIYKQANKLCILGIPVGLVLGYLLGVVLVPVILGDYGVSAAFNPIVFIGSAVFAWITVFISCLKPARLAGKVSPVDALRYSGEDGQINKKIKKSKKGISLTRLALSDIGRNKKRTITMVSSLTLSLVLLTVLYANNKSFDIEEYLRDQVISDFAVIDSSSENYIKRKYDPKGKTISPELQDNIDSLQGLEDKGQLYSQEFKIPLSEQAMSNIENFYNNDGRLEMMEQDKHWTESYNTMLKSEETLSVIYGADGIVMDVLSEDKYWKEGEFDKEKFATGKYIIAEGVDDDSRDKQPTYSVGEKITVEGREFEVMGTVYPLTPIFDGVVSESFSLGFVIPTDDFLEIWPENTLRKLFFNVEDRYIDEAEKMLMDYQTNIDNTMPYISRQFKIDEFEGETRSKFVIGNTISLVLGLIGILNFVNSMFTSIISRKREFAMMQGVGMTKSQLRKLLITEGLIYIGITLVISYAISSFGVGVVLKSSLVAGGGYTQYSFTLLPLIICTPILLILAVIIPYICFKNIEKQSIVERLSND